MPRPRVIGFLAPILTALFTVGSAQAQYNWIGEVNSNWSEAGNWSPAGGPPNAVGASATFGVGSFASIDLGVTVGSLNFSSSFYLEAATGGSLTFDKLTSSPSITVANGYSAYIDSSVTVAGSGVLELVSQSPIDLYSAGYLYLDGAITASGGTIAVKQGLVYFGGTNAYASATRIDAGAVLVADPGAGLSANSNLALNGGILGFGYNGGTLTRSLGSGPGQVQFTGGGGFATSGNDVLIRLNDNTNTLVWAGTQHFLGNGDVLHLGDARLYGYGVVDFQNGLDLNGADRTVRADNGMISGAITNSTGTAGLIKTGSGRLTLTGMNTYNGATTVREGELLAADGVGLSPNSNLVLDGGVFSPLGATFTRSLGSGPGQVQWGSNSGGFAAGYGTDVAIQLNDGNGTLTWGAGGFVPDGKPLTFGNGNYSSGRVDFQNGINLNGASRTFLTTGSQNGDRISGVISNTGATAGVIKDGSGVLELTGTNTYDGPTVIRGADYSILRAADGVGLPAQSNLTLDGGVFEVLGSGTLARAVGTGPGQVQWTANNGVLGVRSGTFVVQLNGGVSGTPVVWGTNGFVADGQPLRLQAVSYYYEPASSLLDFQTNIDLNGANRTIEAITQDFYGEKRDVIRLSGSIGNSAMNAAGVTVTGNVWGDPYIVEFAGTNTYTGPTRVVGGVLRASPGPGLPDASALELNGAVLETVGNHTFTRALGTGAGQVSLTSYGGFSARDGTLTMQLNNGTGTVVWGSPNFASSGLRLSVSASAGYTGTSVLEFRNGLDLNGGSRYVYLLDEATPGRDNRVRISGSIIDSTNTPGVGVAFYGNYGRLPVVELTGTNTYTGLTEVVYSTLRAAEGVGLPAASNLVLINGIYEAPGTATFTRSLGTGGGQVRWDGGSQGGGFSAASGVLTVQLNGGTGTLTAGSDHFLLNQGWLLFGTTAATGMVDFQNGIDLNGNDQQIVVRANPNLTRVVARMSGVISNGELSITGGGVLELTAANTGISGVTIYGATVLANNTSGSATGSPSVSVLEWWDPSNTTMLPGVMGGKGRVDGRVYVYQGGRIRGGDLNGEGTLTLGDGLAVNAGGALEVRVTDGSKPSGTDGGSTIGLLPNPTSNNFLNSVAGPVYFDDGALVIVDGTGAGFTPGAAYNYQVAQFAGENLSELDVTDQARFSSVGFQSGEFRLYGDTNGAVFLSFTPTPVPEPGAVLLIAAAGLVGLRRFTCRSRRPRPSALRP